MKLSARNRSEVAVSKRFPQFPFFAEDFLSGCRTSGMEPELVGIYIQFLCVNWLAGGPIEADPDKLKNALGFGRKTINALIPRLVEMGKLSFGGGMLWNERTQADVIKYQGNSARRAPLPLHDPMPAIREIFAPKIARKSSKDKPETAQAFDKDLSSPADLQRISCENPSDRNEAAGHTRASTSTSFSNLQEEGDSSVAKRGAICSASPAAELFVLEEQGAGLVRNGSGFKWPDPKTGEQRRLSFHFIEQMAQHEPKELVRDFAESELIAAIDAGRDGSLHGILRNAVDKGRLAAFKRRRLEPAGARNESAIEPPDPPPITEGSWD